MIYSALFSGGADPVNLSDFDRVVDYKESGLNGQDLRPAADAIVGSVLNKIAVEEAAAQAEGRDVRPVAVLFGESHTCVSHNMLEQLVLQRLQALALNPVLGVELENNLTEQVIEKMLGHKIDEEQRGAVCAHDLDGKKVLRSTLGFYKSAYAPDSWHNQLAFCLENGVRAVFNDAARKDRGAETVFDRSEPRTRSVLERFGGLKARWLPVKTSKETGLKLRNIMMAEFCEEILNKSKVGGEPRVLIQKCGGSHLFGEKGYSINSQYKDSLVAQLKARDILTVPVFLEHWLFPQELVPEKAKESFADTVFIRGLDQKGRYLNSEPGSEVALMAEINAASGEEVRLYDLKSVRAQSKKEVEQQAPQWLSSAQTGAAKTNRPITGWAFASNRP